MYSITDEIRDFVDEDELPLDPDEFVDRLLEAVDRIIEENKFAESRFDSEFGHDEMKNGLYTRVYAEIQAGLVPDRMREECDDSRLCIHLLKQSEDEFRHARLLAKRLDELGGDVSNIPENVAQDTIDYFENAHYKRWEQEGFDMVKTAISHQAVGERIAGMRHPNEVQYYDEETSTIYKDVIIPDERFHAQVGANILRHYCTDTSSQLTAINEVERTLENLENLHNEGYRDAYTES